MELQHFMHRTNVGTTLPAILIQIPLLVVPHSPGGSSLQEQQGAGLRRVAATAGARIEAIPSTQALALERPGSVLRPPL